MSNGTTFLITGANRGIGLEIARLARERGDTVIAVCRRASDELRSLDCEIHTGVDMTDPDAVATLKGELAGRRIDVLVPCAGILERNTLGRIDYDSVRRQFEVNAIGPLRLTEALADNLERGSRVMIVTSRMGSIADNGSGGSYGYRMSKAAVNMAAVSLARDLGNRGVYVGVVHPGFVRTEMTGGMGDVSPAHAARGILARIDELNMESSGSFWHAQGQILPW